MYLKYKELNFKLFTKHSLYRNTYQQGSKLFTNFIPKIGNKCVSKKYWVLTIVYYLVIPDQTKWFVLYQQAWCTFTACNVHLLFLVLYHKWLLDYGFPWNLHIRYITTLITFVWIFYLYDSEKIGQSHGGRLVSKK